MLSQLLIFQSRQALAKKQKQTAQERKIPERKNSDRN